MQNNFNLNKTWYKYLKFTEEINNISNTSKYIVGHYFLQPTRPTYNRVKTINKIATLSFYGKLNLKIKYYFLLINSFINLLNNFKFKNRLLNKKNFRFQEFDLIIVSHLNNVNQLKTNEDLYFGDLINNLSKKGKKILRVLIPHCAYRNDNIKEYLLENNKYQTYILSHKNLFFKNKLNDILEIIKERSKLLKQASFEKGLSRNLYLYAAETINSKDNQKNLNFGNELTEIVRITKAKNIITTYEGHGWEKIFYFCSRIGNKNIRCFGFLHTLLFEHDYSIYRVHKNKFSPNYIFTTGGNTTKLLESKISKKIKVKTLGSPKLNAIQSYKLSNNNKKFDLLFLPSGEMEEAKSMANFAYNFAQKHPNIFIAIRFHPIIKNKFKKKDFPFLLNFKISEENLKYDCLSSKWAIFSSSTSIFEAIQYGCLPIKINLKDMISYNNPLWQISSSFIFNIKNYRELKNIISISKKNEKRKNANKVKLEKLLYEVNQIIEQCDPSIIAKKLK